MSTEYPITPSHDVELQERSCMVSFFIETTRGTLASTEMDACGLRNSIIRQIEVLSYISEDPEEVLKRFNVQYGQTT